MKLLVLLCLLAPSAQALSYREFHSYLNTPIGERVKKFREAGREGDLFLIASAFDEKLSLQNRWRTLTTMGRMDPKKFQPQLDRALSSREWFMRNAALIALQTDSRLRAVQWSTKLLKDPALVVRTQAVRNLIALNAREVESVLWFEISAAKNFRGSESLWVRAHMAEALAKFTGPGHAKQFQKLLLEEDQRLHKWAVIGLENTTGFKLTNSQEPVEVRRNKWLARLGIQET